MSDDTIHCEGTSSYDCKLGTCHGLPQCGTCCKCTGVCIFEERNRDKPPKPAKNGDVVACTPMQMAKALDGFTWAVQVDGNTFDATFLGEVNDQGMLLIKLGKKHSRPTPAPATGVR